MAIPEGYGVIAGRGRDHAIAALKAAEAAGLPTSVVRTIADGYVVPNAVLDEYEKAQADASAPVDADAADTADTTTDEGEQAPAEQPKADADESQDEAKPATKKSTAKSAAAKK